MGDEGGEQEVIVRATEGCSEAELLLGSVAKRIFRNADCFVVTVGPGSDKDSLIEKTGAVRPFLLATDFGASSLHALPHAISFANQIGAKLVALHVLPAAPIPEGFHWAKTGDLMHVLTKWCAVPAAPS
jgi:nucleotide-binding universal stress UspA family protein